MDNPASVYDERAEDDESYGDVDVVKVFPGEHGFGHGGSGLAMDVLYRGGRDLSVLGCRLSTRATFV